MSTSDQNDQGPLTRKQLREIRLTGSTPVITPDEAAAAAVSEPAAPSAPPTADPVDAPSAPVTSSDGSGEPRLTRRQIRERMGTASVPVVPAVGEPDTAVGERDAAVPVDAPSAAESDESSVAPPAPIAASPILTAVPVFALDDDRSTVQDDGEEDPVAAVASLGIEVEEPQEEQLDQDDVLSDVGDAEDIADGERPTVNSAFGQGLLGEAPETPKPFAPSFDELLTVGDSTGSQHLAPNTLIFTPASGEGSLSGPVASTGELLVTGSYELPKGLGSQGHAHGTTDGRDADAVLIDGELPPASSPTPIAASSAISTIKPAGEVIRPPAPDKGNRLMLTLTIIAGGLALAVVVTLIVVITTNVL